MKLKEHKLKLRFFYSNRVTLNIKSNLAFLAKKRDKPELKSIAPPPLGAIFGAKMVDVTQTKQKKDPSSSSSPKSNLTLSSGPSFLGEKLSALRVVP
jgi:hypothetical protein